MAGNGKRNLNLKLHYTWEDHMFRLLVGFSYDGSLFTGFQRGNGNRSVEDEIQNCMDQFSLGINLRCASRTDRNVSALNNFLTLDFSGRGDFYGIK